MEAQALLGSGERHMGKKPTISAKDVAEDIIRLHSAGHRMPYVSKFIGTTDTVLRRIYRELGIKAHPTGTQKGYDETTERQIVDLYTSGLSMAEVERRTRVDDQTVKKILTKFGIELRYLRPTYPEAIQEQAMKLYLEGASAAEVARTLDLKTHTIKEWIRKAGVVRTMSEAAALAISNGQARGRVGRRSLYRSSKSEEEFYAESSYELHRMRRLDGDADVLKWERCRHRIEYLDPVTGRIRNYVPDFLVERSGGIEVEEVKPLNLTASPTNLAKFDAARSFFRDNGISFVVLSEGELGITEENLSEIYNQFDQTAGTHGEHRKRLRKMAVQKRISLETSEQRRDRLNKEALRARTRRHSKRDTLKVI